MTGSGVENDKKVEVRITLRLARNEYRYLRETRLPGESFGRSGFALISEFRCEAVH